MIDDKELKDQFQELINDINIPKDLKAKIIHDAFENHYLYSHMLLEISKLSPNKIDKKDIVELSFYSYLYFATIIFFDKYYDNQTKTSKDLFFFFLFEIKEKALLGLSDYFKSTSEFWRFFFELKEQYFKFSNPNFINNVKGNIEDSLYFNISKGKGILVHNYVNVIDILYKIESKEKLSEGLNYFNIGFQIYDDYKDLREDYNTNNTNFILYKIIDSKKDKTLEYYLKLSYINGTIKECLLTSIEYLEKAKLIFKDLNLKLFYDKSAEIINFTKSEIFFIDASILKAKDKTKNTNYKVGENSIDSSKSTALFFLKKNLKEGFWKDFLTNAGYGQEWITGYVLCMLGEIDRKIQFLEEPLQKLKNSNGSYNEYIVQDGDSSNFMFKAFQIFEENINPELIQKWLHFSKNSGGWSTYYNDDIKRCMNFPIDSDFSGWFSSQLCVSAVSAWVAKEFSENKTVSKKYIETLKFIKKNQNEDGSWDSYWWTENIYSTSFAILAYPDLSSEYDNSKTKAIDYLISKQTEKGCWYNGKSESAFYTALALKSLIHYTYRKKENSYLKDIIEVGINWLLNNQMEDGSWKTNRILRIPYPDIKNPNTIKDWKNTSFGLNCLVDDHNRIFTTATAFNTISLYEKYF